MSQQMRVTMVVPYPCRPVEDRVRLVSSIDRDQPLGNTRQVNPGIEFVTSAEVTTVRG